MGAGVPGQNADDVRVCLGLTDRVNAPAAVLDPAGVPRYANEAWRRFFGEPTQTGWAWLESVPVDSAGYVRGTLERALSARRNIEIEFDVRRRGGSLAVLACAASPVDDAAESGLFVLCWDITERQRNEERLAFMAGHDPLTGLANRRTFEEALARAVSRAERGTPSALLLLDLDNLKRFNDRRGHLDGDQALVNLALLLRTHVRAGDLPARIGGDEFAVLFEGTTDAEAGEIADRIRETAASEEFVAGAREHDLGVSGGIVCIEGRIDARTAFDRADAALYAAKAAGRDRIVKWTPEVASATSGERISTRVREAFADDGFHLVFQPVVRLADKSVAYFESFVRMSDPVAGELGPREFLPFVERLGLMPQLTRRVVDLALWELASTPRTAISVNLGPGDLADEELLADIERVVGAARSAHGRLLFEIPEPTLLAHLASGRSWMERLSRVGCRFVLDDFGTGMGMFVLLRERHLEHIKLSQAAMRAMASGDGSRAFVSAMRELIETQNKAAVASYCETEELLGQAKAAGFTYGQGYGVSEPYGDLAALAAMFESGE